MLFPVSSTCKEEDITESHVVDAPWEEWKIGPGIHRTVETGARTPELALSSNSSSACFLLQPIYAWVSLSMKGNNYSNYKSSSSRSLAMFWLTHQDVSM